MDQLIGSLVKGDQEQQLHQKTVFCRFRLEKNDKATTRNLVLDLHAATWTRISRFTAEQRLNEVGLYAKKKPIGLCPTYSIFQRGSFNLVPTSY